MILCVPSNKVMLVDEGGRVGGHVGHCGPEFECHVAGQVALGVAEAVAPSAPVEDFLATQKRNGGAVAELHSVTGLGQGKR